MSNGGQQFGNSPYAAGGQYGAPGQYGSPVPMPPAKGSSTVVTVIIVVAVVLVLTLLACGVLAGLMLPAVQAAREAARRMQDSNNMKQIVLAMFNFSDANGGFPAPAIVNAEGEEVLSWRIQLLPYIESAALYSSVDLANPKPWDDPQNAFLLESTPMTYQSPRTEPIPSHANVFVIATQPGAPDSVQAAFTHGQNTKFSDFKDGASNTIVAIMFTNTSVEWTRPSAMTPEEAYAALQNERTGVNVAMADGSVRFITSAIDKATFLGLCTRNGGEIVSID